MEEKTDGENAATSCEVRIENDEFERDQQCLV